MTFVFFKNCQAFALFSKKSKRLIIHPLRQIATLSFSSNSKKKCDYLQNQRNEAGNAKQV